MNSKTTLRLAADKEDMALARRIRLEVFIDEQGIPAHLDDDGLDESAFHVLCRIGNEAVGTGRFVIVGDASGVLGRIAVRSAFRSSGLGKRIVQALESVAVAQNVTSLSLQPHLHLEGFYQSLGYHTVPGTEFVGEHELLTMRKELDPSDV